MPPNQGLEVRCPPTKGLEFTTTATLIESFREGYIGRSAYFPSGPTSRNAAAHRRCTYYSTSPSPPLVSNRHHVGTRTCVHWFSVWSPLTNNKLSPTGYIALFSAAHQLVCIQHHHYREHPHNHPLPFLQLSQRSLHCRFWHHAPHYPRRRQGLALAGEPCLQRVMDSALGTTDCLRQAPFDDARSQLASLGRSRLIGVTDWFVRLIPARITHHSAQRGRFTLCPGQAQVGLPKQDHLDVGFS